MSYATEQPTGYHNFLRNVAIVGASGQIGTHIVRNLLQQDRHRVTAITRADSAASLPAGVEKRIVDYAKPETIVEALRGQDALLITMAVTAPPGQQDILIRAAADAKVPWILPNEWGIDHNGDLGRDTNLGPKTDAAAKLIQELGVSKYIRFTCGFWYEYSLGCGTGTYGFGLKQRPYQFTILDDGRVKLNTSTFDQVGLACARLLALKTLPDNAQDETPTLSRYANGTFYMASFCVSQLDMFESVKRVTNTTDADWQISHEGSQERYTTAREKLLAGDFKAFGRMLYSRTFYPDGSGDFGTKFGLQNKAIGLPETDLDEATQRGVEHAMKTELQF